MLFPLMRPSSRRFDDWADGILASGPLTAPPTKALIEDGLQALGRRERTRIARWLRASLPLVVRNLERDVNEEDVILAALTGAVVAGLAERGPIARTALALIEEDKLGGHLGVLRLAVDPCDLWSPLELQRADAAAAHLDDRLDDDEWGRLYRSAVAVQAERLMSSQHRRRLARLVGYTAAQLPIEGYSHASQALESACAEFRRDRHLRDSLAAALLGDLV